MNTITTAEALSCGRYIPDILPSEKVVNCQCVLTKDGCRAISVGEIENKNMVMCRFERVMPNGQVMVTPLVLTKEAATIMANQIHRLIPPAPFKVGDKILCKYGSHYYEYIVQDIRDNGKAVKMNDAWRNFGEGTYKFVEVIK